MTGSAKQIHLMRSMNVSASALSSLSLVEGVIRNLTYMAQSGSLPERESLWGATMSEDDPKEQPPFPWELPRSSTEERQSFRDRVNAVTDSIPESTMETIRSVREALGSSTLPPKTSGLPDLGGNSVDETVDTALGRPPSAEDVLSSSNLSQYGYRTRSGSETGSSSLAGDGKTRKTAMAEHGQSDSTPFTVFDYLGLGFILEPPGVLVHAVMTGEPLKWSNAWYAVPFVVVGATFIYIGRNWVTLKERANSGIVEAVDTLSRSYLIPFLIVLFALIGIVVLPIWIWPSNISRDEKLSTADEIAAAVVRALDQRGSIGASGIGQMPIGGAPTESLLEQPSIDWDGKGPIIFHARVDHSGEKLAVYLDWGNAGGFGQSIINSGFYSGPRLEIGFVERFVVGQSLSITIGTVSTVEGGQQVLQWGEPHYNNTKVGISGAGYVARVVIIGKDGKEERYPFLIVPRFIPGSTSIVPPAIVGTGVLQGAIQ
jgi:hypothetical protein